MTRSDRHFTPGYHPHFMSRTNILFVVVLLTTLYFGLRPFNFFSVNDVGVGDNGDGLIFHKSLANNKTHRAIAFTEDDIHVGDKHKLSIDLKLKPLRQPNGLGILAEFYDGQPQPALLIAQWLNHLVIRSRRLKNSQSDKQYREIGLQDCLFNGRETKLLISSDNNKTELYLNNQLVAVQEGFQLIDPEAGKVLGRLVVGNNAFGGEPWFGLIKKLTVYADFVRPPLSSSEGTRPIVEYEFKKIINEEIVNSVSSKYHLKIPPQFKPVAQKNFSPISRIDLNNKNKFFDAAINFVGFFPYGFCLYLMGKRFKWRFSTAVFIAVSGSFLLSLSIESLQIYLPTRNPSWQDLLLNTVGGGFAALILAVWSQRRHQHERGAEYTSQKNQNHE